MRILYFVQYFNRPEEPGGSRAYQFARAWISAGHQVTLITGAVNHKTLSVPEQYRRRLWLREQVDGIEVLRVWSYAGIRRALGKRIVNFLSFALTATLAGCFMARRPDLIYASSTPLTAGIPGALAAWVRRRPFVFEVRDLWPQSAVVAGILRKKSVTTRLATWLAHRLYSSATRIVALTRGIAAGLREQGVPADKILLVPNGVDDWMVEAPEPEKVLPPRERFVVVYCGAHGRWNGLGQILDAAELLKSEVGIEFLFIGDGDERDALIERARSQGLHRVTFRGAESKREAFRSLCSASASVVVTWKHPFQRMILANKIFDYLAAGRPVLVAAEGEMAELVRAAGAGLVVPPEEPEKLAAAIKALASLPPEEREKMGERARRYILEHYQRRDLAMDLLRNLVAVKG